MARLVPANNASIQEAAEIIRGGGIVAFPTETVYGLGANALNPAAVARIFAAKGRPNGNPLIIHIADPTELTAVADVGDWSGQRARQAAPLRVLIERFWPGPLTLVLPKLPAVPDIVTAGGQTVAVRMPRHPVALALIRAAGVPLAAPSANRSEQLSPTRAEHVIASLGNAVDLILDGGPTEVGLESTVLDLTEWPPRLLRPGMVTVAEIELALSITLSDSPSIGGRGAARSPGQQPRHYAPRTPLRIVDDIWAAARDAKQPVAVLAYSSMPSDISTYAIITILQDTPNTYAAHLYDTLHTLDNSDATLILVEAVPDTDEWLAVRDRLTRAATTDHPGLNPRATHINPTEVG